MNEKVEKHDTNADAELEREIRAGRKFTLSEAIGRMAGPGAMKGISPITRKKQAETEIEEYLRTHLSDTCGALRTVLLRRIKATEHLQGRYGEPLPFLVDALRHVLESEYRLKEIVTEADIEWGKIFGERPFFEKEGSEPHPDDPYTLDSVRKTLQKLLEALETR